MYQTPVSSYNFEVPGNGKIKSRTFGPALCIKAILY
jgi:hypothetical protein